MDVYYRSEPYLGAPVYSGLNWLFNYNFFLNYTQVTELYGEEYNLSPRFSEYDSWGYDYRLFWNE